MPIYSDTIRNATYAAFEELDRDCPGFLEDPEHDAFYDELEKFISSYVLKLQKEITFRTYEDRSYED